MIRAGNTTTAASVDNQGDKRIETATGEPGRPQHSDQREGMDSALTARTQAVIERRRPGSAASIR
jgi:hypothetical protein